jgi:alkyl hydroperoxide reductase subunit AhpC
MEKTGFFEEAPQQKSANRLVFIVGSFWVMAFCSYLAVASKGNPAEVLSVYVALQGVLTGGKLVQKNMEKNEQTTQPSQGS